MRFGALRRIVAAALLVILTLGYAAGGARVEAASAKSAAVTMSDMSDQGGCKGFAADRDMSLASCLGLCGMVAILPAGVLHSR